MKKRKKFVAKILVLGIILLLFCATIVIPKGLEMINKTSDLKAEAGRQIYGIYNANGQQVINVGLDGKFYVGDVLGIYAWYEDTGGDGIVISTTNPAVADVFPGGANGLDEIHARGVGTAIVEYHYLNDSSVKYQIEVVVSDRSQMYGFYNMDNQQIQQITIVQGQSANVCAKFRIKEGNYASITTGSTIIGANWIDGGTDGSLINITANNLGTTTLTLFDTQDPAVSMQLNVVVEREREIYGFYDENNQPITQLTMNKGDIVNIYGRSKVKPGDSYRFRVEGDIIGANFVNIGLDSFQVEIRANKSGTVVLGVGVDEESEAYAEIPVTVNAEREIYGFYDANNNKITNIELAEEESMDLYIKYKIETGDTVQVQLGDDILRTNWIDRR